MCDWKKYIWNILQYLIPNGMEWTSNYINDEILYNGIDGQNHTLRYSQLFQANILGQNGVLDAISYSFDWK